jgi:hypothetical protein
MSFLRGLIAWTAGVGALSATLAAAGVLLAPATVDGPVVPPISPPGWHVVGEKE